MLDDIRTPDRAEAWLKDAAGKEDEDHGLRSSRLQKRAIRACRSCARSRAISGKRIGQRTMGSDLRKSRGDDGARETALRQRRSLCRACLQPCSSFPPELNTPIFAVSRVAGWCAHVVEQHDHNRLIRPRSLYTGPKRGPIRGSAGAMATRVGRDAASNARSQQIAAGKIRSAQCLLGLRPGEPRTACIFAVSRAAMRSWRNGSRSRNTKRFRASSTAESSARCSIVTAIGRRPASDEESRRRSCAVHSHGGLCDQTVAADADEWPGFSFRARRRFDR